ncbi:MAG: hypothetical protein JST39_11025, partial [Bacteroidetes bacterium]|nr:hypothetical protein [Bacteroidota bacterium]
MRTIFQRRYVFHLLFWLMCIVFILLEMQYYVNQKGWGFALLPMAIHILL